MLDWFFYFYSYIIFFYSMGLVLSYITLMFFAGIGITRNRQTHYVSYARDLINNSPYTPGVSIVAPAYNEEATIINNVESLLAQDYPLFEVVIVNDGSKDRTLDLLIEHFSLTETPYVYVEHVHSEPFRRMFKSTKPEYSRLVVVDKNNGGTKADAVNAGINVASYDYFINTDVDCILSSDAIFRSIMPILEDEKVIAVSGMMAISNGCEVDNGIIIAKKPPRNPIALFQCMEYMRSFIVGKMGWSFINSMSNVSGGYGMFDKNVVIDAGGYNSVSFAEDMDMLTRMIEHCRTFNKEYRVIQIPVNCCWTEAPSTLKTFYRQRVRWGRGLMQTFVEHRNLFFNFKYGRLGVITLPYVMIFEFFAPIIEVLGLFTFIWQAATGMVNWQAAWIIMAAFYLFSFFLALMTLFYDYAVGGSFDKIKWYALVFGASVLEPFIYHPISVFCSLKGYLDYIFAKKAVWGEMTRRGFSSKPK